MKKATIGAAIGILLCVGVIAAANPILVQKTSTVTSPCTGSAILDDGSPNGLTTTFTDQCTNTFTYDSTTTTTSTTTSSSPSIQLASNYNAVMYLSSCLPLNAPSWQAYIEKPLMAANGDGSFTVQMNVWSPSMSQDSFQQYIFGDFGGQFYFEYAFVSNSDYLLMYGYVPVAYVGLPLAGGPITMSLTNDSLGRITGGSVGLGGTVYSWNNSALSGYTQDAKPASFNPAWKSPAIGYAVEFLGVGRDYYSSGAVAIHYYGQPSVFYPFKANTPSGLVWAPPQCSERSSQHTAETSPNFLYSGISALTNGTLTQTGGLS